MPRRKINRKVEGDFDGTAKRFAIVVARFNDYITTHMLDGCVNILHRHNVKAEDIEVVWVPGAFELATAAKKIAGRKDVDAIICIGCVIRGDTPHYDHVCEAATKGIAEVGRRSGVPCIFGVLTCETVQQAVERAGTKMGNKGGEAAMAALEMASLMDKL